MNTCLFCDIVAGSVPSQKKYETEDLIVIPDIHPQAPIHYLIIPKQHYKEFIDMPTELLTKVVTMAKNVITQEQIQPYRLVNNGYGAAVIDHFHLHVLGSVDKFRSL